MSIFNQTITQENGKDLKAYVVRPTGGDKKPGVIVMHEVYGVTDGLTEIADRFAKAGFIAACPNMYWRENPDASFKYDPPESVMAAMEASEREKLKAVLLRDRDAARSCMFNAMNDPKSTENIIDTINKVAAWLRSQPDCTGAVASTGFCFGGRNTYLAMAHGANVDAGISFYPTPKIGDVFDRAATQKISKPYMFVVGGEDGYISDGEKQDMTSQAKHVFTYVSGRDRAIQEKIHGGNDNILTLYYANSNHGFNRRESKYSDPGTSDHVMRAATEFLDAALNKGKFIIPVSALNTTPDSPTYHPPHKV